MPTANIYAGSDGANPANPSDQPWFPDSGLTLYSRISEGISQPTVPTAGHYITGTAASKYDADCYVNINTLNIPVGLISVTAITLWVYGFAGGSGSGGSVGWQTNSISQTGYVNFSPGTSAGWYSATVTGLSMTAVDLATLQFYFDSSSNGVTLGTPITVQEAYFQITYTGGSSTIPAGFWIGMFAN